MHSRRGALKPMCDLSRVHHSTVLFDWLVTADRCLSKLQVIQQSHDYQEMHLHDPMTRATLQ